MLAKRTYTACFLAVAALIPACKSAPVGVPYAAGEAHLSYSTPATANGIEAQVWYPATSTTGEREVFYTTAYWGHAAPDAAVVTGSKFPLVIIAHGWRGTRFDMSYIAEDLARHGYMVASLDSPGCDGKSYDDVEGPKIWFRATLLQQLIDAVAGDSRFAGAVDTNRVAVIGHSAGGSTALVLAGAEIDANNFAKVFPQSAPVPPGPWHDARIKAAIALSPGTGPAFNPQSFKGIIAPVMILSGTSDNLAPEASNAKFYAEHIPGSTWHSLDRISHYSLTQTCSPYARARHFATCSEVPGAPTRDETHTQALQWIRAFVDQNLGKPASAVHAEAPGP